MLITLLTATSDIKDDIVDRGPWAGDPWEFESLNKLAVITIIIL